MCVCVCVCVMVYVGVLVRGVCSPLVCVYSAGTWYGRATHVGAVGG